MQESQATVFNLFGEQESGRRASSRAGGTLFFAAHGFGLARVNLQHGFKVLHVWKTGSSV